MEGRLDSRHHHHHSVILVHCLLEIQITIVFFCPVIDPRWRQNAIRLEKSVAHGCHSRSKDWRSQQKQENAVFSFEKYTFRLNISSSEFPFNFNLNKVSLLKLTEVALPPPCTALAVKLRLICPEERLFAFHLNPACSKLKRKDESRDHKNSFQG